MKKIHLEVPEQFFEEIMSNASRLGVSVSDYCKIAVVDYPKFAFYKSFFTAFIKRLGRGV